MAISADSRPHSTTIAAFVSELNGELAKLFGDVLLMASELGLIGREHFLVDGCKLPCSASKRWSGTHEELSDKRRKLEAVAARIVSRHRERDGAEQQSADGLRDEKKIRDYGRKIEKLKELLASTEKKLGPGSPRRYSHRDQADRRRTIRPFRGICPER